MAEDVKRHFEREALKTVGADTSTKRGRVSAEMQAAVREGNTRRALEAARAGRAGINQAERDAVASRVEPANQTAAKDQLTVYDKYGRQRYEGLDQTEQDDARDAVLDALTTSSVMGEYVGKLSGTNAEKLSRNLLQDTDYRTIVNKRLEELSTRKWNPADADTKAQIDARIAQLRAATPGLDKNTARTQATAALQSEFQQQLSQDIDNVYQDSVHELVNANLEAAEDVVIKKAVEVDQKMATDAATKLEHKWASKDAYKKGGAIEEDFNKFLAGGIDALLQGDPDTRAALNKDPDLKKQYEDQIGQSLLLKRMRTAKKQKLSKNDIYQLADAKWMGATSEERQDKLVGMFEQNDSLAAKVKQYQEKGYIDRGVWDNLRNMKGSGALAGALVALLAVLALPVASGATLLYGGIAGGGAIIGNTIKQQRMAA